MNWKNLKIGTRLFSAFAIVLGFLLITWLTGMNSIGQITHQLKIAELVNSMLTDAQDIQAASLRFNIYNDEKYIEMWRTEKGNILQNAKTARSLMKSETNKIELDSTLVDVENYNAINEEYARLEKEKFESDAQRVKAAQIALSTIKGMLEDVSYTEIMEKYGKNGYMPAADFWKIIEMQKVRNHFNVVRILSQKYQIENNETKQDEIGNHWKEELRIVHQKIAELDGVISDKRILNAIAVVKKALGDYEVEVDKFQKIVVKQRNLIDKQRQYAQDVMDNSRHVRNGVYAFIEKVESQAKWISVIVAIFAFVFSGFIAWILTRSIVNPVKSFVEVLQKVSNGDLTQKVEIDSKDEVGLMAENLRKMMTSLNNVVGKVKGNSQLLASASEELSVTSNQMFDHSKGMLDQASSVGKTTEGMSSNINMMATAAEEMSVNANEVAGASEQMSQNMNAISSAIEEMSVSITEIAKSSDRAREIAERAIGSSQTAQTTMDKLGTAAGEIGNVTEVIKRIAEQTNLLALNATIEAASAGEAGKGFAVVANEIKELASQSAKAADDIARRIEGVQGNTKQAVDVIGEVSKVIDEIGLGINSIASSVEQQTKAANDISSNVSEASKGANNIASAISEVAKGALDVSSNSADAAKGSSNVSQNISSIQKAAKDSNEGADQVRSAAKDLSKMAVTMQDLMQGFKTE